MKLQELMETEDEDAKILQELQAAFPDAWFKPGDEWSQNAAVWSGEGSYVDGNQAFNYNSWESDPQEKIWKMGIHNKLFDFVEDRGYYWEANDPGTYILYKSN